MPAGAENYEGLLKLFDQGKATVEQLLEHNRRLTADLGVQLRAALAKEEENAQLFDQVRARDAELERVKIRLAELTAELESRNVQSEALTVRLNAAVTEAKQHLLRLSNLEVDLEVKRQATSQLEQEAGRLLREKHELARQLQATNERIRSLETGQENLTTQIRDWEQKYADSERKNDTLANLYLASFQLHSTLELSEVITTLKEILINFVGAQSFAILLVSETRRGELEAVATEGLDHTFPRQFAESSVEVFSRALTGDPFFAEDAAKSSSDFARPVACIPLATKQEIIGLLAIYGLLVQKDRFTSLDHQLFTLLSRVAATAIVGSKLYSHSEGALSSLKSFLGKLVNGQRREATP